MNTEVTMKVTGSLDRWNGGVFRPVITERRPTVTAVRDPMFRLARRVPGIGSYLRALRWYPVAAGRGF
jgi:hypothetical protein